MAYCRKCGALIDDYAAVCPKCGTPQNGGPNNPPPAADNGGFLWGLLGCCIPIAGLILFLIWKDTKPRTAKAAGIGDVWLAERIRQMLSTGELRMLREDRERFYRSVVERT